MADQRRAAELAQATAIARRAGEAILRLAADPEALVREKKADQSWVTAADRASERMIRAELEAAFPGDSIIGEEMGCRGLPTADRLWVIDPIDGTTNFVHGLPIWCVAVGLLEAGQPTVGVLYMPATNDMYAGAVDHGAWLNDAPMHVWNERGPWTKTDPVGFSPNLLHRRPRFPASVRPRILGSSQMHFGYVARGTFRAGMWRGDYLWDLVAGAALVRAAGGVVVDLGGHEPDFGCLTDGRRCDGGIIACGPHSLHVVLEAARSMTRAEG